MRIHLHFIFTFIDLTEAFIEAENNPSASENNSSEAEMNQLRDKTNKEPSC